MATLQDIKRSKILKSGTKLANQAASVSEKGSRARDSLTNKYLTQAPTNVLPTVAKRATGILGLILTPTATGDGTLKADTVNKAKAAATLKSKRRPSK